MTIKTTRIGSDYEFESENEDWFQQLELIYAYDFLTSEECETLIEITTVIKGENPGAINKGPDYRKVQAIPLHALGSKITWLTDRIQQAVRDFNYQFYRFDISALDGLSLCTYNAEQGSQYRAHNDCAINDGLMRKLTVVIQLTDPSEYQEGTTVVLDGEEQIPLKKERGSINIFPSFLTHRVDPITQGTRHALVTWVAGPPFR